MEGMDWLPRDQLLTYEEIARIARVCVERFGFESIRLTGGEPLIRAHIVRLIELLAPLERRPRAHDQRREAPRARPRPRGRRAPAGQRLARLAPPRRLPRAHPRATSSTGCSPASTPRSTPG